MHRLLIALSLTAACTATVRTAGPPPSEPAPPPPPPTVVHDHREPTPPPPAPPPPANPPPVAEGAHPAYVSAIRHLRYARALIERTGPGSKDVKLDEAAAIREIDAAIKLAHDAHVDDGKPLTEHPAIDDKTVYPTRLRQAVAELGNATHDLNGAEDNAWGQRDRDAANQHIYAAERMLENADRAGHAEATPPPAPPPANAHPAYVAALGNLRHARALLERTGPAAGDVKWDEKVAIREIDAAFGEVKQARMDDGQPMTEHPPIDAKLVYRDRLREAAKLLGDSARDLEEKEDNGWAKKDRKQAIEHVRRAEKAVQEAVSDRKADAKEKAEVKAEIKEEKKEEKAEKKAAKGH